MRTSFVAVALGVTLTAACSQEPSFVSGKAHRSNGTAVLADAVVTTDDPHSAQRDVTVSSYCLSCHPIDLANSHPVGRSLAAAALRDPVNYMFPPASPAIVMVNGEYVECTSCHDDGSAGYPFKNALPSSVLCGSCHNDKSNGDVAAPTVVVTSPSEGATLQGTISVAASATDDCRLAVAELFVGPAGSTLTKVATLGLTGANVSFSFPLDTTAVANGAASILVRVYDSVGRIATSAISVAIDNAADTSSPTVAIVNPAEGAMVRGSISVDATASDDVGVARVELWVGPSPAAADTLVGTVVPTGTAATFLLETVTLADGPVAVVVRAYDAAGNMGSAAASVVVDNTPPSVAVTSPADGSSARGVTTIAASATDANAITGIDFYVDGALVGSSTAAPYTATWDAARRSGVHTITAVATDQAGNAATSAPVTVRAK